MRRTKIPDIYNMKFPEDWKQYIDSLISKNPELNSSDIAFRMIRQDLKTRLEGEYQQLILQGIKPYTIANLPRIKAILSYLHTNQIWPFYAIGCGHCEDGLDPIAPFPPAHNIPGCCEAAAQYPVILRELARVRRRVNTETREFIYTGIWRSISLWESNQKGPLPSTKFFSETMNIIRKIPLFDYVFTLSEKGEGFKGFTVRISLLKSETIILPHYGLTNTRIRLQIPLEIPEGDLYMYCHDQYSKWKLGTPLLLNDSYMHGVFNNTSSDRVVLLIDLPHPRATSEQLRSY